MVHQPDRDIDVLAEVAEDEGSGQQDLRFVRVDSKCPPSKIDTGVSGRFRVFAPTHHLEPEVTMGRQGESRAIMRIALYRSLEEVERSDVAVLLEGTPVRESAQVQIVGG
jgi:hypothetical protein